LSTLRIELVEDDRGAVVRVVGQGALGTAEQLQSALRDVAEGQPARIVVDLSGLSFASSLVMGTLIWLNGRVKQYGGVMKLAALQPKVLEAFEAARMSWAVPIFDSVEAAFEG
jgi:anti-anti-sigma factor